MRKRLFFWLSITFILISLPFKAQAQGKISGLAYIDYYYIGDHHNENIKGKNGFWARRVYFTYDYKLSSSFDLRLRLEGNSPGDFKSKMKIEPYVKDIYLEYKRDETSFFFGLSGTPTWSQVEKYWGYRSVVKTPLDLQKMGSVRDLGVAIKGYAADKKIYYHFMLGNGEGTKGEVNKEKKVYAAIGFSPVKEAYFELYGDYTPGAEGNPEVSTLQAFFAYKRKKFRAGIQYSYQTHSGNKEDFNLQVASGFAVFYLKEKVNFLARLDRMFQANPYGEKISYSPFDSTSPNTVFLTGVDFKVANNINFIPNIGYVNYDNINASDFYLKLTMYFRW